MRTFEYPLCLALLALFRLALPCLALLCHRPREGLLHLGVVPWQLGWQLAVGDERLCVCRSAIAAVVVCADVYLGHCCGQDTFEIHVLGSWHPGSFVGEKPEQQFEWMIRRIICTV